MQILQNILDPEVSLQSELCKNKNYHLWRKVQGSHTITEAHLAWKLILGLLVSQHTLSSDSINVLVSV